MFIMMMTKLQLIVMEQREANKPTVLIDFYGFTRLVHQRKFHFAFFQELEAKLEASRLREEKLVAEVESVRVVSMFGLFQLLSRFNVWIVSTFKFSIFLVISISNSHISI